MTVDLVDRHAITNLRKMCKLERARLARMTDLSVQQITQLEEGGVSAFSSVEFKIQAALKVASILSGVQDNGLPVANVFYSSKAKAWKRFTVRLAEQGTNMWLILLEALGAGLILVLIVWWTMSGRNENKPDDKDTD